MSKHIHRSHNVSVLLYHIVCPAKYRRTVFSAEVDAVLVEANAAGATIARSGAETFWGGYSGVFVDPDGHVWEIAHNPFWTLDDDGSVRLG